MLLGIDIGGTSLKAGIVDPSGHIVRRESVPTPASLDDFARELRDLLSRLVPGAALTGAGIGCPGVIRPSDTVVEILPGRMSYLEGVRLSEYVQPWILPSAPVCAGNDARTALAGELMFGAAQGKRDVLMLTLGSGVGGAMVVDGMLAHGHAGIAGHIGHLTVNPAGPYCLCGNRGCLETVFSARAFEVEAAAAVQRGCDTILRGRAITCENVFACAAAGDAVARQIISRGIEYLGGAIAGLLHVLDAELVILGGQIAEAGEPLFEALRADVQQRTRRMLGRIVPIAPARIGPHSGIVGAASLVLHAAATRSPNAAG